MIQKTEVLHDTTPQDNCMVIASKDKTALESRNVLLQYDEILKYLSDIERGNPKLNTPMQTHFGDE